MRADDVKRGENAGGVVGADVEPTARLADEADRLEELGDEIATLAAHIHAATHRLLALLGEFDRAGGWKVAGFRSCAHWLAWRTGVDLGAAREKVRSARALEALPLTSAAMARGELSFAKVRALTRVATPDNEGDLLELARAGTAANLERVVRAWRWLNPEDEARREEVRHRAREFSVAVDLDGMYVVRGRFEPEVGALFMRALEAADDALFRRAPDEDPARRRADAMALLAERALAAGFGAQNGAPVSGSRAERYQVVLHVSAEPGGHGVRVFHNAEPRDRRAQRDERSATGTAAAGASIAPTAPLDGGAELEDGTRVSAETSRRLACDAGVVALAHSADGAVLDVGRRTRTIPPAIRRALDARDRGCRFPGCGSRFSDGHHVRHWADGGATRLDNLVLLCRAHHRMVHEGGYRVELVQVTEEWAGGAGVRANFYDPRGLPIPDAPPRLSAGDRPVDALIGANHDRGIRPDWRTAQARWRRDDDIPQAVLTRGVGRLAAG